MASLEDKMYKMNLSDLVSVIIPCFNRANMLPVTINSVYNQSYRPIECIIVDDGSSDNTKEVVSELQKKLSSNLFSIRYLFQKNNGAPSARNLGTENSSGEFIQYLDSDDLIYPDKLNHQIEYLQTYTNIDGVYGDWDHGTLDNKVLIKGLKCDDMVAQFYGGRVIHTLSFLFRRSIVDKIGSWDTQLKRNQEVDFHLRGVLAGGHFEYLPQTTGLWREHDGDRIINSNGLIYALKYHEKWIIKLAEINKLNQNIKIIASQHLFYKANALPENYKSEKLKYIKWAIRLNPNLKEFNSSKFFLIKKIFGLHFSVWLWIKYGKHLQQNRLKQANNI